MKQIYRCIAGLLALIAISFTQLPASMVGQWQQKLAENVTARSNYRADGTLDIFINGKNFVSGKYKVSQDTLFIADPVCGVAYYGMYRLTFFTPDSVRQTLIQDTCQVRSKSIRESSALSRIKTRKP